MIKQFAITATAAMAAATAFAQPVVLDADNQTSITDTGNGYDILNENMTLAANGNDGYILSGTLVIPAGVTLTIQPGVVMRGQPEIESGTDFPGALVVARDGMLIAEGTASSPIIFTTAADSNRLRWESGDTFLDDDPFNDPLPPIEADGTPNTSLWGAVTMLGNAPTNLGWNVDAVFGTEGVYAPGQGVIEGFGINTDDFIYGGSQPNDSSGSLRYVSIRHTGATFSTASEQQGLTLGAVGYGTTLEYIDIYCSSDDGIEVFGGTASIKHFMISYAKDDALDLDQGYTGMIQFGFLLGNSIVGEVNGTDYVDLIGPATMAEWDGDDTGEGTVQPQSGYNDNTVSGAPFANPTLYNMTIFGGNTNNFGDDEMLHLRNNFGGNLYNSYIAYGQVGSASTDLIKIANTDNYDLGGVEDEHMAALLYGFADPSPALQAQAGTLNLAGNVFWKIGDDVVANNANSAITIAMLTNDTEVCPGAIGNAFGTIDPNFGGYATGSSDNGTYANNQLEQNGVNPVPYTARTAVVGYTGTFFDEVNYTGAFPTSLNAPLFTTGWTAMNLRGILVNTGGDYMEQN